MLYLNHHTHSTHDPARSITTSMVATVDWATHDNYLFDISVFGLAYEFTVFL